MTRESKHKKAKRLIGKHDKMAENSVNTGGDKSTSDGVWKPVSHKATGQDRLGADDVRNIKLANRKPWRAGGDAQSDWQLNWHKHNQTDHLGRGSPASGNTGLQGQVQATRLTKQQMNQERVNDICNRVMAETEYLLQLNGQPVKLTFENFLLHRSGEKTNHALNLQTYLLSLYGMLQPANRASGSYVYEVPQVDIKYVESLDRLADRIGNSQDSRASKAILKFSISCLKTGIYQEVPEHISELIMSQDKRDELCKNKVKEDQAGILAFNEAMHRVNDASNSVLENKIIADGTAGRGKLRAEPILNYSQATKAVGPRLKANKNPHSWPKEGDRDDCFDPY